MPYSSNDFEYGPVLVLRGPHKGRIGDFDDDTIHNRKCCGVVRFAPFGIADHHYLIPITSLRQPNTNDLLIRYEELWRKLTPYLENQLQGKERICALEEWSYIASLLNDRMFEAQFMRSHNGARIFLSHSSSDKSFVKGLAVDLAALGHKPWLDEWEILGGESIPARVAEGLEQSDFVVVVLSDASVKSRWVENEWQAKYWDEINERHVTLIPLLLSDCQVPTLLKARKYIDFRQDYNAGLEGLARSLSKHLDKRST